MQRWGAGMVWLVRAVLVMAVVLLLLYVVNTPEGVGDDSMVGRATIAAPGIVVVLALLEGLRRWVRAQGPVPLEDSQQAAQQVVNNALKHWEGQALLRRINGPDQMPVGWKWAASEVAIPAEGMNPPHEGPRSGLVTDLVELYRDLDPNWKRLVILGGPGSGKTVAMTLLLINILRDRKPHEPVPVWITLGSWNPKEQSLRDYAAAVIGRDFPSTRAESAGGRAGPAALLDSRQVALFLDGLDEMPT